MEDLKGTGNSGEEQESEDNNGKYLNPTPILDELVDGQWPSFIKGFKDFGERTEKPMVRGVLDQLEYSYKTKMGYWKADWSRSKVMGLELLPAFP